MRTRAMMPAGKTIEAPVRNVRTVRLNYVLITAARNEEVYVGNTIRSVLAQSIRPVRWLIVSDGSTDRTDEIVRGYVAEHPWIELVQMPQRRERHFGGKAGCFAHAYEQMRGLTFDLVGNVDADISFDADYYRFLVSRFEENPRLGIGGTPFVEDGGTYDYRFSSLEHVSGACQMFRRECYEAIGGYLPLACGGIDVVAVLSARRLGWETRTFPQMTCMHHREMGSAGSHRLLSGFRIGKKDYLLGRHPLWQLLRSLYQMTRKPVLIGGGALLLGYAWAAARRLERPLGAELIAFQRREQMSRLRRLVFGWKPGAGVLRSAAADVGARANSGA